MKTLIYAFALSIIAAVACFFLLTSLGIEKEIAKLISTVVIGALPKVKETLEKIQKEGSGDQDLLLVKSFGDYDIHPGLAVLYVIAFGLALLNFVSALAAIVGVLHDVPMSGISLLMFPFLLVLGFPLIFLSGRWIGQRYGKHPYLLALLSGVLLRIVGTVSDILLVPAEQYELIMGSVGMGTQLLAGSILFSVLLVAGAFVGRRQRLSAYLTYLLKQLSPESRVALVDLAYEEALQIQRKNPVGPHGVRPMASAKLSA